MTDEERKARELLAALHTPELDRFRERVPTMNTSELLVALIKPNDVLQELGIPLPSQRLRMGHSVCTDEQAQIAIAAGLAVIDEIDRRIPILNEMDQRIQIPNKLCPAQWHGGLITPPNQPERPSGPCSEPFGHNGDHIFPNNNRQPRKP